MAKKETKKQKLSECCKAPMIGGVQCENCGSNGKFTTGTAIIKRLDTIVKFLKPEIITTAKGTEQATGERFIDCGDGTIKDTKMGLMWPKEGSKERMEHKDTEAFCKKFNVGGYDDWRMPEVEELFSLVDFKKSEPSINEVFKCEPSGYWTKTLRAGYTDVAWFVFFYVGHVGYNFRYSYGFVRPVRQYF